AMAWGLAELCSRRQNWQPVVRFSAMGAIGVLGLVTFHQTSYWRNSETLWNHTLACTDDNALAHNNLGMALISEGKVTDAIGEYQKALEIEPAYTLVHFNLGTAYGQSGDWDKAIEQYQKTVDLQGDYLPARNNLADALLRMGQTDKAIQQLEEAIKLSPHST